LGVVATSSDPHGHHDWHSSRYVDEWITHDVTRDGERMPVLLQVAELLPFADDAAVRVLDVGGGYGMLTRAVLVTYRNARVVLHDFSVPMIEQARERLADVGDRVEFVTSDLRDPHWVDALDGPYDAVVSSIAFHNVRDPDRIRAVYGELRPLVSPGGCVANLDLVFPGLEVDTQLSWLEESGFHHAQSPFQWGGQALLLAFA
jgi:tRNA (cmo5U34)-methyltransferase